MVRKSRQIVGQEAISYSSLGGKNPSRATKPNFDRSPAEREEWRMKHQTRKKSWKKPEVKRIIAGSAELLTGVTDDGPGDMS